MHGLVALLLAGLASAQEPATVVTPELHRALRTYQAQHLHVRNVTRVMAAQSLSAPMVRPGWAGPAYVTTPGMVWTEDSWQVLRGAEVLDVPSFLGEVGDVHGRDALLERARQKRRTAGFWYTVGAAGAAAMLGGLVQMERAGDVPRYYQGAMIATGGTLTLMGGLVAGSLPSAKARRLVAEPAESLSLPAVERVILDHNEALRRELGLSPAQAMRVEDAAR